VLAVDPVTPSTLYAGTDDGVYKYETVSDGGSTEVADGGSGGGGGGGCFIDTLADLNLVLLGTQDAIY